MLRIESDVFEMKPIGRLGQHYLLKSTFWIVFGLVVSLLPLVVFRFSREIDPNLGGFLCHSSWWASAWFTIVITVLLSCELYGREVSEGSTMFFAQLPLSRAARLSCKAMILLLTLSVWACVSFGVLFLILSQHPPTSGIKSERLPALLGVYCVWLMASGIAAVFSDRSGNLPAAIILGCAFSMGTAMSVQYFFQPHFGVPLMFICGASGIVTLAFPFLFSCDTELKSL
jgi:ABC-type transport system involved in multi-copper enzyme maturation permease subunit